MCHSEPTIYGATVRVADEIGREDAPDCCGEEMTRSTDAHGDLIYTCGCCRTEVEVDDLGLVFDIREKLGA